MYSENIINRFTNPKNSGHIKHADGVGTAGNPNASDVIKLLIKVENEKIVDAKFKAFGCVVAIAATDVLVDIILNKTISQASKISSRDILSELGMVDNNKTSCLTVAIEALHDALQNYKEKQEREKKKLEAKQKKSSPNKN